MTPNEFLPLLWTGKPKDLYILIWTLQDRRSYWFKNIDEAAQFVNVMGHCDVYTGVGLAHRDMGVYRRCPSSSIAGICGLWADLDLQSDAHEGALPETIEDATGILRSAPTEGVATGNGLHAWWLFDKPWIFKDDADRRRASSLVLNWHTLLRNAANERGWRYDRLSDLSRLLRIPGTWNRKDAWNPKPVTVHSSGPRYTIEELTELTRDVEAEVPDTPLCESLALDLSVRVSDERINELIASNSRFADTWYRQRHDLRDQSQSGYDMAIANFGVWRGLSAQEITDLIVTHRALYKERQRDRIEYYQQTISRANSRKPSPLIKMRIQHV